MFILTVIVCRSHNNLRPLPQGSTDTKAVVNSTCLVLFPSGLSSRPSDTAVDFQSVAIPEIQCDLNKSPLLNASSFFSSSFRKIIYVIS